MRVPWKLIGLAGLAGVGAGGAAMARRRRTHHEYRPDELRERLHGRLAEVEEPAGIADEAGARVEPGAVESRDERGGGS